MNYAKHIIRVNTLEQTRLDVSTLIAFTCLDIKHVISPKQVTNPLT